MKVASISVVAQHPRGLDMHVRNLRWALEGTNNQIYIFTQKKWNFNKKLYPDVRFIEANSDDPMKYHPFWRHEIPNAICTLINEEMLLFSEQDIFYITKLKDHIDNSYKSNKIVVSGTIYHPPLFCGHVDLYPRVWEGGCIIPSWMIRKAVMNDNITIGNQISSEEMVEWAKKQPDDMIMHGRQLNQINIGDYIDTMYEFTLYCYRNAIPITKKVICTHFYPTDRIHRLNPEIYDAALTKEQIDKISIVSEVQCCLFAYYVCGVIKASDALFKSMKYSKIYFRDQVEKLMSEAEEWMLPEEFQRACELTKQIHMYNIKNL